LLSGKFFFKITKKCTFPTEISELIRIPNPDPDPQPWILVRIHTGSATNFYITGFATYEPAAKAQLLKPGGGGDLFEEESQQGPQLFQGHHTINHLHLSHKESMYQLITLFVTRASRVRNFSSGITPLTTSTYDKKSQCIS
jgi:hypothetical protein